MPPSQRTASTVTAHAVADRALAEESVRNRNVQVESVNTVGRGDAGGDVVRYAWGLTQTYDSHDISVAQCFIIHGTAFHIDTTEKSPFVHVNDKFIMNPK
jgi:acyl transferase domain-containing protein